MNVIAVKGRPYLTEGCGEVEIILIEGEDGEYTEPNKIEHPTKRIFVSKGYDKIDEKFKDDVFFKLNNVRLDDQRRMDRDHSHFLDASPSSNVNSVANNELLNVYCSELPELSSGRVFLSVDDNKPFFIFFENKVYGAFTLDPQIDDEVIVSPHSFNVCSSGDGFIHVVDEKDLVSRGILINCEVKDRGVQLIKSFSSLRKESDPTLEEDYINDQKLINYFNTKKVGSNKAPLSKKEALKLKNAVLNVGKQKHILKDKRFQRFELLLDEYLDSTDAGHEIVVKYLSGNEGNNFLTALINEKPEVLKDVSHPDLNLEIDSLKEKKSQLNIEVRSIEESLKKAKDEYKLKVENAREKARSLIEEAKSRSEEEVNQILSHKLEGITEQVDAQENILNDLKNEIDSNKKTKDLIDDYKDAKTAIKRIKGDQEEEQKKLLRITDEIKTISDVEKGLANSPDLKSKLAELKR